MKKTAHFLVRLLKITGIVLISFLLILFLAPYIFPDSVGKQIKRLTNRSIKGEVNFTRARLSFFTHFPSLTLTLYNVDLKGSTPFEHDTLIAAEKLGFGVNLEKLIFGHEVSINKIYLDQASIRVLVDENGKANYNIYVSDSSKKLNESDSSSASLHLEKIIIEDSHLFYNDRSIPMMIEAEHLYYEGTGDLSKSIFDLQSSIQTDSLNFILDGKSYVKRKAIDADLVTRINTKTLALIFDHNKIKMNELNFIFNGTLDFLKNGYHMDFNLSTENANLYQLITILPPEYLDWLRQTTVKGIVNLTTTLKGDYITSANKMPYYAMRLAIRDGYISHDSTKLPLSQLNGLASLELPELDPEQMHVKVDSLNFHMDKNFFKAALESRGLSEPNIDGHADAEMDMENLKRALGIRSFDMQGHLTMHVTAKGKYNKKVITRSLRNKDTLIASIPAFNFECALRNGFVRYYKVPQPIQNIFINMSASCKDSDYRHAYFKMDTLHVSALNDFVEGRATVHASTDFPMDVHMKGNVNLADIPQVYPLDSISLSGLLSFNINASGKYAPEHHLFPKANAHFSLHNGLIQTKYYPHPIEKINLELNVSDKKGDLNGLQLSVQPAALNFEGKPFYLQGNFRDFNDLNYDLSVNGELDLGRIYQVFARKDVGVSGLIKAHADFKGRQSDATNGRYNLLKNTGTLEVKNLAITYELFPKPFLIRRGNFRFYQDKMWFDAFQAAYGKSDLQLDGYAENVINYVLSPNETLKANFNLKSKTIDLNEFAVYAPSSSTPNTMAAGVILIPKTLNFTIKADADRILYNDISLNHFRGGTQIDSGSIELIEADFDLIGCHVTMKGRYSPTTPMRANFDYQLTATDFDVQRAYKEIKLFHDLASSAEHASGIISIDYTLSGKLNERMNPIYPSLTGKGILTVKKVKFNGFKLFNSVSSQSGKSDLKDPDLSKIDVKSSIKNNLINIEKLKFKANGFRIRFEGQTSFDNKVNFKMRIGLPPLGIIGIPVRITGSSDNLKIRIGKSDSDPLQEKSED